VSWAIFRTPITVNGVLGHDVEMVLAAAQSRREQFQRPLGLAQRRAGCGDRQPVVAAECHVDSGARAGCLPMQRGRGGGQRRPVQFAALRLERQAELGLLAGRPEDGFAQAHGPLVVVHLPAAAIVDRRAFGQPNAASLFDGEGRCALHFAEEGGNRVELVLLLQYATVVRADQHQPGALGDGLEHGVLLVDGQHVGRDVVHARGARREEHEDVPFLGQKASHALHAAIAAVPAFLGAVDHAGPENHLRVEVHALREFDHFARLGAVAAEEEQGTRLAVHVRHGPVGVRRGHRGMDVVVHFEFGRILAPTDSAQEHEPREQQAVSHEDHSFSFACPYDDDPFTHAESK
jgi:hypothetical protein